MFPELKYLAEEVREHLALVSHKKKLWKIPLWWLSWSYPIPIFIAWRIAGRYLPADNRLVDLTNDAFTCGILLLMVVSLNRSSRWYRKSTVQSELARIQLRPPICLLCGYNLRGTPNESTTCPECGAEIAAVAALDEN